MNFYVPGKYKPVINFCLVIIPIISIVASIFTMPVEFSLPLSIAFVVIPILLSKFVFKYSALLIMPGGTDDMQRFAVGSCWYADDNELFTNLGLGLVYKYKDAAKDAFQMFKAWNYGKYNDNEGNIQLSLINEGDGKYSLVIYPGDRIRTQIEVEMGIKDETGPNSLINMLTMRYFIHLCLDYSNDKQKQKMIETIPYIDALQLCTAHIKDDELILYSKRKFKLSKFNIFDRDDLNLGELESMLPWGDPYETNSEHVVDIVERIRERMSI